MGPANGTAEEDAGLCFVTNPRVWSAQIFVLINKNKSLEIVRMRKYFKVNKDVSNYIACHLKLVFS